MFVVRGKTNEREGAREGGPTAEGFPGLTGGLTGDGGFVVTSR